MTDSMIEYVTLILYGYCSDAMDSNKTKALLKYAGVSVNLSTCWTGNKAEVEYKNKLYTIDV